MMRNQSPSPITLQVGQELAVQLLAALRDSQQQTRTTKNHYQSWRGQSRPQAFIREDGNGMFEAMLTEVIMAGLGVVFGGTPLFDTIHNMSQIAYGTNAAMRNDAAPELDIQRFEADKALEAAYALIHAETLQRQTKQQQKLAKTQEMLAAMMHALEEQANDEPLFPFRAQEELAGDVLRRPRYAQMKQNRHSMDCIRSAFERSANTITPPLFAQPRYRMAG
jgi:hypothetical protein